MQKHYLLGLGADRDDSKSELSTKELILEAGHKAITAKSYHACGLKEILEMAGVPKGSFYHHFKSKEDFGLALIETSTDEYNQYLREFLTNRKQSPVERLKSLFDDKRDYYVANDLVCECAIPKMALELSQLSEPMRAALKYSYDSAASIMAQCIREGQASGEITNSTDADILANMIKCGFQGVTIRVQIDKSMQPYDDYIALIFSSILK